MSTKMTEIEMQDIKNGKCPVCGGDQFQDGPSAGLSWNIRCADCESIFCINAVGFTYTIEFRGVKI